MDCSIEDMIAYKNNALKILNSSGQFATASKVEELFNAEILRRQVESGVDIKRIISTRN